jgi:hypothetical protein
MVADRRFTLTSWSGRAAATPARAAAAGDQSSSLEELELELLEELKLE